MHPTTTGACRKVLLPEPPRSVVATSSKSKFGVAPPRPAEHRPRVGGRTFGFPNASSSDGSCSGGGHLTYGGDHIMQNVKLLLSR
jgi:hypothetical protein